MLELSIPMRFVMARAAAEAVALKRKTIQVEHVFLGLLKLAEMNSDLKISCKGNPEEIGKEIEEVQFLFLKHDISTSTTRSLLRRALLNEDSPSLEDNEAKKTVSLLIDANDLAEQKKAGEIRAIFMLEIILKNPPRLVEELCRLSWNRPPESDSRQSLPPEKNRFRNPEKCPDANGSRN